MPELIEIGTDREVTVGHDGPPRGVPGVRWCRAKEVRVTNRSMISAQVDSVLSADGWRPAAPALSIPDPTVHCRTATVRRVATAGVRRLTVNRGDK